MEGIVSVKAIVDELDALGDETSVFLNKKTGELVVLTGEVLSGVEDSDDDISECAEWEREMIAQAREVIGSDDYLHLPDQYDINEYDMMENFCYSVEDREVGNDLLYKIKGSGAFRRFKNAVRELGIEEKWYRFREEKLEEIAIDWLEAHEISYTKD